MGVALQAHAASGIVHGHLPDSTPTLTQAEPLLTMLRTLTREAQGNLVLTQCDDLWKAQLPVFGHPEQSWSLMRKLKQQLDPQGRLSPGRLFKDL